MKDVVVMGAGLAGLHCALILERSGLDVALLEAQDAAGGRVRTDEVDGFLLDRGFQVLLTAYPEAQSALDIPTLDLRPLSPGALVWHGGRFHRFADPFREPLAAVKLALDPIVTLGDKLRVGTLRGRVRRGTVTELFSHEESSTRDYLKRLGFSPKIIDRFFAPFFGGVFLEKELITSSRYFAFLFRMFSTGAVGVPAAGMQAVPRQLAGRLQPGTLRLNSRVTGIESAGAGFRVLFGPQESMAARAVVLATEEPATRRLLQSLGRPVELAPPRVWNSTTAFYFAAERAPVEAPILMLNGEGGRAGPVNNAVVLSEVARSYAPIGASLISASVIGQAPGDEPGSSTLAHQVREHLGRWFGANVAGWRLLGARPVPQAVPLQLTARWESSDPQSRIEGIFLCGDYLETASVQGSLVSGRRAAESLLQSRR